MIIKGRSRSNGMQLAGYLIREKNDSIKILDIRGTIATQLTPIGLRDALNEMDAIASLAQGEKNIFHAVINPNDLDRMSRDDWQAAITKTEEALGLTGQPRVIVSHTYQGKEHLHIAWSRVDTEKEKLISDSFCNLKMVQTARELEQERGLFRTPDRNKNQRAAALNKILKTENYEVDRNQPTAPLKKTPKKQRQREKEKFNLERSGRAGKEIGRDIATAWHQSLSGEEFRDKLNRRGLRLIRGKRGAVVMDESGVIHSPARYIENAKVDDINAKCAQILPQLPNEDQARQHGRQAILSPRKAESLVKSKLVFELANDRARDAGHGDPEPF